MSSIDMDNHWTYYVKSTKLDINSIMIYNSNAGSDNPTSGKGWVIHQKGSEAPVWMGGSKDPAQSKISEGDVARVAQLYPLPDGGSNGLQNPGAWGPVRVRIRDQFEMEVPPPRRADDEL